jgi:protein-S-isoprenylcysteine O-methyltransferase Ste14
MRIQFKDKILVSIQFVLFGCYLTDVDWKLSLPDSIQKIGLFVSVWGLLILSLALLQLNKNLSPFPTPKNSAVLIQLGLYKWVRHPIYSGIIFMLMGYAVYQTSIYKLCITGILMFLFHIKTNYEEQQLTKKFPEYVAYKRKTGKFFIRLF